VALLSNFLTADTGASQQVRARLVALRGAPEAPAPGGGPGGALQEEQDDDEPLTPSREGRLVRRWVPAPLRDARWEPGRSGAVMLSSVAALAALIAAIGVWWERPVPEAAPVLPLVTATAAGVPPTPATHTGPGGSGTTHEVVVSVVGRVVRPGLVRLPEGTRVADALAAAGGALPHTDVMALNLARRLSDGEQLLVGVAPPPGQPALPVGGAAASTGSGPPPALDLNTATLEQLDGLPGVGEVTAQRILDWRAAHGRFSSVDQLREVSGIGQARFTKLRNLVRV
jgi:competence protein ComEA